MNEVHLYVDEHNRLLTNLDVMLGRSCSVEYSSYTATRLHIMFYSSFV